MRGTLIQTSAVASTAATLPRCFPSALASGTLWPVHTHIGAIAAVATMLYIALLGTLWRLGAVHFVASSSSTLQNLGKAMLFQY